MRMIRFTMFVCAASAALAACGDEGGGKQNPEDARPAPDAPAPPTPDAPPVAATPTNVLFFLGDGMGVATITAARIYSVGEDGDLTMDTLPETGWVRTYSKNALVTDSAPSMSAYMTGVKMNNDVIAMSADTKAIPTGANNTVDNCAMNGPNGTPATTILEQAQAAHRATGVVTTTRVTHATPAATYAHTCHRDLENLIAAQAVDAKLDVLFGGGLKHFLPSTVTGGFRTDGRDLTAELAAKGYTVVKDQAGFAAIDPATTAKAVGLFTLSHMSYELDRDPAKEPSLAEMTTKAMDLLARNPNGYFLMVEGGRIDHALHETNARRALGDTIAFDDAIKAALAKARATDPDLAHTLIVVTADHDHTMTLNGYARRTGATSGGNAGILGLVKDVISGTPSLDAEGHPYAILGFGNGERRVAGPRADLDEATTSALGYHQEAAIQMPAGGETHGGTDVSIMAIGHKAELFHGFMTNTAVFALLHDAAGF
jgi:alkaline phosphatase